QREQNQRREGGGGAGAPPGGGPPRGGGRTQGRRGGARGGSHDPGQGAEGLGGPRRRPPLVPVGRGGPGRRGGVAPLGGGAVPVGIGNADAVVHHLPSISGVKTTCTVRSSAPRTTRSSRVPPCAPWSAPNRSSTPPTGWPAAATIRSPEERPARAAGLSSVT